MSKTPFFVVLAKLVYGNYLKRRFKISVVGAEQLARVQGGAIVLSNHVHALDSFLLSSVWPTHIRWVAGAHLFKHRILGVLLTLLVTAIAKQQGRSDYHTIKEISKALKNNQVVGIFPEGTRTWDGDAIGFDQTTAKLVRMFKAPVVLVNLEGGYAIKPRWALHQRQGSLTINIRRVLEPTEFATLKLNQIHQILHESLDFSHNRWQEIHHTPFYSDKSAMGVEKVLYLCPQCLKGSTLKSKGQHVTCENCSYQVELTPYDRFTLINGQQLFFEDVAAWHNWEKNQLAEHIATGTELNFPADRGVLLELGVGARRLKILAKKFTLLLTRDALIITPTAQERALKESLELQYSQISAMVLNLRGCIELFYQSNLYRIHLHESCSPLKYLEYWEALKEAEAWNGTTSST